MPLTSEEELLFSALLAVHPELNIRFGHVGRLLDDRSASAIEHMLRKYRKKAAEMRNANPELMQEVKAFLDQELQYVESQAISKAGIRKSAQPAQPAQPKKTKVSQVPRKSFVTGRPSKTGKPKHRSVVGVAWATAQRSAASPVQPPNTTVNAIADDPTRPASSSMVENTGSLPDLALSMPSTGRTMAYDQSALAAQHLAGANALTHSKGPVATPWFDGAITSSFPGHFPVAGPSPGPSSVEACGPLSGVTHASKVSYAGMAPLVEQPVNGTAIQYQGELGTYADDMAATSALDCDNFDPNGWIIDDRGEAGYWLDQMNAEHDAEHDGMNTAEFPPFRDDADVNSLSGFNPDLTYQQQ